MAFDLFRASPGMLMHALAYKPYKEITACEACAGDALFCRLICKRKTQKYHEIAEERKRKNERDTKNK